VSNMLIDGFDRLSLSSLMSSEKNSSRISYAVRDVGCCTTSERGESLSKYLSHRSPAELPNTNRSLGSNCLNF
jgi:hypothetical protein